MVRSLLAVLLAAVCISALAAGAATCTVAAGAVVMLRSSDFDPDVLVWDSRQRAIDYVGGNIRSTNEVLEHTVLSKPGTRALVIACDAGGLKPRYSTLVEDAVGIKITTGPNKGHYGWIASGDVRGPLATQSATP